MNFYFYCVNNSSCIKLATLFQVKNKVKIMSLDEGTGFCSLLQYFQGPSLFLFLPSSHRSRDDMTDHPTNRERPTATAWRLVSCFYQGKCSRANGKKTEFFLYSVSTPLVVEGLRGGDNDKPITRCEGRNTKLRNKSQIKTGRTSTVCTAVYVSV